MDPIVEVRAMSQALRRRASFSPERTMSDATPSSASSSATTPSAAVSVSAAVAAELEHEARDVFALMGNGNAWFLDAVVRRGAMTLTTVRHEAATVAAADAY